ncbi:uncharacterized protein LOC108864064 [Galendromus occidentalis]|uniref:Uncharacterized protein LOC108864064 n=1 Tax=Galendromus occidentalis TaxID=34638 RepID=A0AAJ7P9B3_9ACAR|nr:uncharacterized protein LOC108864064 [Galendromus occidentalis]
MPKRSAPRKTVQSVSIQKAQAPAPPVNLVDLRIPPEYTIYNASPEESGQFLLKGSGPESDRILIFGRGHNIGELRHSKTWFIDGTFSLVPPLSRQVYVILAEKNSGVHPFLYVFLPNKTEITYTRMFVMFKCLHEHIDPEIMNCDSEMAAINAIRTTFPNARVASCFFRLVGNMTKHLGSSGLTSRYNNEENFACFAKMITSLASVPPGDIEGALAALAEEIPPELQPLLFGFEDNCIGRSSRRGDRLAPLLPSSLWSVYERILGGSHRTNNHAEAAHRRLQMELNVQHPSL